MIKVSINLYDLDQFLYYLAVNTAYLTQKKNKSKTVIQYSWNYVECLNNLYLYRDIFCIHTFLFFSNKFVFINNVEYNNSVNIILYEKKMMTKLLYDFLEFYLVNFHLLSRVMSISHGMITSKKNVNIA